jgi:hypothetical protein
MRPAISQCGTMYVMIESCDIKIFRLNQGVSALGVLVHLMALVSLDPYRTQVRNVNPIHQWFVPVQFAELKEITGMSTGILRLALKVLKDDGWIEQTSSGYLLHDVTAREAQ